MQEITYKRNPVDTSIYGQWPRATPQTCVSASCQIQSPLVTLWDFVCLDDLPVKGTLQTLTMGWQQHRPQLKTMLQLLSLCSPIKKLWDKTTKRILVIVKSVSSVVGFKPTTLRLQVLQSNHWTTVSLVGFEPTTLRLQVLQSNHWTTVDHCCAHYSRGQAPNYTEWPSSLESLLVM